METKTKLILGGLLILGITVYATRKKWMPKKEVNVGDDSKEEKEPAKVSDIEKPIEPKPPVKAVGRVVATTISDIKSINSGVKPEASSTIRVRDAKVSFDGVNNNVELQNF